jgi:hypothetical protein
MKIIHRGQRWGRREGDADPPDGRLNLGGDDRAHRDKVRLGSHGAHLVHILGEGIQDEKMGGCGRCEREGQCQPFPSCQPDVKHDPEEREAHFVKNAEDDNCDDRGDERRGYRDGRGRDACDDVQPTISRQCRYSGRDEELTPRGPAVRSIHLHSPYTGRRGGQPGTTREVLGDSHSTKCRSAK